MIRGDIGAATVMPRWLRAVWLWVPALAALLVFGAIAVLQLSSGFGAWWWALAAVAGLSVLSSGFDVAYLLLLFVPCCRSRRWPARVRRARRRWPLARRSS